MSFLTHVLLGRDISRAGTTTDHVLDALYPGHAHSPERYHAVLDAVLTRHNANADTLEARILAALMTVDTDLVELAPGCLPGARVVVVRAWTEVNDRIVGYPATVLGPAGHESLRRLGATHRVEVDGFGGHWDAAVRLPIVPPPVGQLPDLSSKPVPALGTVFAADPDPLLPVGSVVASRDATRVAQRAENLFWAPPSVLAGNGRVGTHPWSEVLRLFGGAAVLTALPPEYAPEQQPHAQIPLTTPALVARRDEIRAKNRERLEDLRRRRERAEYRRPGD